MVQSEQRTDNENRSNNATSKPQHQNKGSQQIAEGFPSGASVKSALDVQNHETLKAAITKLRNQLTVRHNEPTVSAQDARLQVARGWLGLSPAAKQIFDLWDYFNSNHQNAGFTPLLLSTLANLLILINSHHADHSHGFSIVKALLGGNYIRRLAAYLGGTQTDLILITLKLFNAMAIFAGGKESKAVLEAFPWGMKALPKLLQMRRKSKEETNEISPFAKPDIRTAYITFVLSFVSSSSTPSVKATILDQRDAFTSIFKDLYRDPYLLVERVLEVCWQGIWCDSKIRRSVKVGLFSEWTLGHIVKLYDRGEPEGPLHYIPAELAHQFLLSLCTHPGTGLCYRDRGWYPRPVEDDEEVEAKSGRIYNKILGNFVKTLRISEDSRQHDLALRILESSPELVQDYWTGSGLTLEPRLSSRWITNIAFAGEVVSLPIPLYCFLLAAGSDQYNPIPPSRSAILTAIIPSTLTKIHLTKGLQSSSRLVRHFTALFISKSLRKCFEVLQAMSKINQQLEGDDTSGAWTKRGEEILSDLARRLPDLQVIFALSQNPAGSLKGKDVETAQSTSSEPNSGSTPQGTLLQESSLRLLWLYHVCFPDIVSESRLDVGKVVGNTVEEHGPGKMVLLSQLHVIRILSENESFNWAGKLGSSQHSAFHHIIRLLITSTSESIRSASSHLITKLLSQSVIFEHDASEVELWLVAFPLLDDRTSSLKEGTSAVEGFINFLDDCLQRCLKTPYRYLEESLNVYDQLESDTGAEATYPTRNPHDAPSPLLFTVIEQFRIRYWKGSLNPTDSLDIASFLRKLVLQLAGKQPDIRYVRKLADIIATIPSTDTLSPVESFHEAVKREAQILLESLSFTDSPTKTMPSLDVAMDVDINKNEKQGTPISRLVEMVHSIRVHNIMVDNTTIMELFSNAALECSIASNLPALIEHIDRSRYLWSILGSEGHTGLLARRCISFPWALVQAGDSELRDIHCLEILVEVFTRDEGYGTLRHNLQILLHRLHQNLVSSTDHSSLSALMMLIGKAFKKIKEPASKDLKIMLFSDERIKSICMEPRTNTTETALQLPSILAPSKSDDRELASPFASYWASMVMDSLNPEIIGHASQWVPFMPTKDLTACFDRVLSRYLNTPTSSHLEFIKSTLSSILALPPTNSVSIISSRFLTLLQLRHIKELQNTISTALKFVLEQSTPFGVCVHESKIGEPLSTVIPLGIRRWSARSRQSLSNVHLSLEGSDGPEHWDDVDVKIASALLYGSQSIRRNMSEYLSGKTAQWVDTPSPTLLPVIHAFLDVTNACQEVDSLPEIEGISGCFNSLIGSIMSPSTESMLRKLAAESAVMLIQMLKSRHGEFNKLIASAIEDAPNSTALDREVLWFVEAVATLGNGAFNDTVDICAESGLKWVVRRFAEDPSDSSYFLICLHRFGEVLKRTQSIKSYIAEPVLTAAAKHRVKSREALEFVAIIARHVQLKPVNTNRLIQALVQHPSLNSAPRGPLTAFLHALFTSHPSNTCQPSQVTPLIRLYRGTQSVSDRRLLSIFQLFETERRVSIASLMNRWNEVSGTISQSAYEALTSMDPAMMFRTCTSFPQRQSTVLHTSSITETYHDTQSSLYDPIFVLTFAGSCLVDEQSQPKTALEWVEFFRTNVGSLAISALSSKEVGMRKLGGTVLIGLWKAINNTSFQERDQAVYILGLLKNLLEPPSASETSAYPPRLPTYATLVLSHALHAVFYPSTFLYPIVSRFLLQRPQLDAKDVPMLYGMLYSSSINTGGTPADSEIERNWMIRFLADGMRSTADWKVLKRRHTWDLLATMFQSGVRDRDGTLRLSILQVLLRLTSNQEAVTSLVLHSGLLSWMEMQILHSSSAAPFKTVMSYQQKEHVAWMQVLDHIVWTLNWEKVRKAGGKCWIESIGRCLIGLTDWGIRSIDVLLIECRVLTRLSTVSPDEPLATSTTRQIGSLVEAILNQLQKGEGELISSVASSDFDPSLVHWVFPHSMAGEIKKRDKSGLSARDATSPCQDDLSVWGECISLLWRIVMELNLGPRLWDALTVRILIWNVLRQKSYGDVWDPNSPGEWARRQVIACMVE